MSEKERIALQTQLYLAHKEAQEEDKRKRNINRIYRIHLDSLEASK